MQILAGLAKDFMWSVALKNLSKRFSLMGCQSITASVIRSFVEQHGLCFSIMLWSVSKDSTIVKTQSYKNHINEIKEHIIWCASQSQK